MLHAISFASASHSHALLLPFCHIYILRNIIHVIPIYDADQSLSISMDPSTTLQCTAITQTYQLTWVLSGSNKTTP